MDSPVERISQKHLEEQTTVNILTENVLALSLLGGRPRHRAVPPDFAVPAEIKQDKAQVNSQLIPAQHSGQRSDSSLESTSPINSPPLGETLQSHISHASQSNGPEGYAEQITGRPNKPRKVDSPLMVPSQQEGLHADAHAGIPSRKDVAHGDTGSHSNIRLTTAVATPDLVGGTQADPNEIPNNGNAREIAWKSPKDHKLNPAQPVSRADRTAPIVTYFSPTDGAVGVALDANIVLTFNEAIQRGRGTITLRTGSARGAIVESFNAATSPLLDFSGNTLTINPTTNLKSNTRYFLVFPRGSVKDLAANSYAGTNTYDFRTLVVDATAPAVSSFSPADGATGVAIESNIVVTFNEAIARGTGIINLHTGSATGSIVESFNAASSDRLTFNGNILTIDPITDLTKNTRYFLVLPNGSVKDLSGNHYAGTSSYDFLTEASDAGSFSPLNNPLYSRQWHLNNTGQNGGTAGIDVNVELAWGQDAENGGTLGRGVIIAIVDDGLQRTHPDLQANYRADASYDYNFGDSDPSPSSVDSHGTAVAGVAAAVGNNTLGVTGAAPLAQLSGIRLIAGAATDAMEAKALNHALQLNSIYSNSWGPADSGTQLAAIGPQARQALYTGITTGRDGKGAIYTWAGGNGYANRDNSNYDGYANSPYVIAVGAVNNYGKRSSYSESGANLLVSAPSSGGSLGIVTTDLMGSAGYNGILSDNYYTNQFGGTSSATPLVSGVIALMLEANSNLSWRDVMHILVNSSQQVDSSSSGWQTNGAGHTFHHDYGHGMVDANAAVTLARSWTTVEELAAPVTASKAVNQAIPDQGYGSLKSTITVNENIKIESVEILFNATHTYRGDLEILLTSPSGSTSVLATQRGDGNDNYSNWTFSSRVHWDEVSQGNWTLTVTDRYTGDIGTLLNWGLTINGTRPPSSTPIMAQASNAKADSDLDVDKLVGDLITQAEIGANQNLKTADSNFTSRLNSDALVGEWGGMDASLRDRLPHLDAYIAWVNERVSSEEIDLKDVEWTVATYAQTTSGLDRITGIQNTTHLGGNIEDILNPSHLKELTFTDATGTQRLSSKNAIDTFSIAFQPDTRLDQITTTLTDSLGSEVAFFYPNIARQQTLRSEQPWIEESITLL